MDLSARVDELKKRRREIVIIFFVAFLFLLLTWFEIRLFSISQQLPFVHSIFFFGLVNFNIVLLLLLIFLIFRNVVKVFVERRGKILGSSLKAKLIAAFVAFSTVPTILVFTTSVFYINSSFDKWFSVKMAGVLKSSLEVTNAYYFQAKKRNYHFAHEVASEVARVRNSPRVSSTLKALMKKYSLDAVEYYPSLRAERIVMVSDDDAVPAVPAVSQEFLLKGLKQKVDSSTIHQFGDGNLVRVIVPVSEKSEMGAVVVSSFVPLSLISKMNDITSAYDEFRDVNPLEYPLKSIYVTILGLMTLVILLAATWFGFHLAKQLSIPIAMLGRATKRVAGGDYTPVDVTSGSEEISNLVDSFNLMTVNLANSEREVRSANLSLKETLDNLDRHTRYVEVVLGNVSTGVISVDNRGKISTINRHAGNLLKIDPEKYLGRPVRDLLTIEYFRTFSEMLKTMQDHKVESIQRELKITVNGEELPLLATLSVLKDERGHAVGRILVFDDLTMIVNSQRAAAWTEVARRIAHEIKNPLTPIKLSAERLQRKFKDSIQDPAFDECTTMIIRQTEDLKNLVNEFTQFARLPQAKPIMGSIHSVIEAAISVFRVGHSDIDLRFEPDPTVPEFKFDPGQLQRVFVNLIDNAIAAVAESPQKQVVVSTKYDSDLKILRLTVADTGSGIPRDKRNRIFEPYYSTKENGTGLGLAIVKRIVEDHSGFIRAFSHEPEGTKMIVELPIRDAGMWKPSDRSPQGEGL